MQFALMVNAAADSAAALTALATAQAIQEHPEHTLYRVFFYRDGVQLANRFAHNDSAPVKAITDWQAWVQRAAIDASVCIGAAQRRGVVSNDTNDNLAEGFTLCGLGQWIDARQHCDRVIQFG